MALCYHLLDFDQNDLKDLTLSAARASFLPEGKRELLINQITAELKDYLGD
jgi:hypothetical protein